jgi:transposase
VAPKLRLEEIVTLQVLKTKGQSNTQIAHTLGVSEGTVRYHLRRDGHADGRKHKPRKADALAAVIDHWVFTHQPAVRDGQPLRPVNIRALFDWLGRQHAYTGSYKSVLRFVRARYPKPRLRPFRRVETPPGAHYGQRLVMFSAATGSGQQGPEPAWRFS